MPLVGPYTESATNKTTLGNKIRDRMATPPMPFQVEGVRFMNRRGGRAILGDTMGLGKTYQAIAWAALNPKARPVVVVCPATVKAHWQRQFLLHAGIQATVLHSTTPRRLGDSPVYVVNYDILHHWVRCLRRQKVAVVILDECQVCMNVTTIRSKACAQLAAGVPHVLACSGTPIDSRPVEFYPVLSMVAPEMFPSRLRYLLRYCDPKPGFRKMDYNGASNLDELHEMVSTIMLRRLKKDVMSQLPRMRRSVLPVDIDNWKEYAKARDTFVEWYRQQKGSAAAWRVAKAQAFVRMGALKRLVAEGKLWAAIEWIEQFLKQRIDKIAVFAVHHNIINALRKAFPRFAVVTGLTPEQQRQKEVDRFCTDSACRGFLGNLKAAGVGLDGLQQVCSTELILEIGWTPSEHDQVEGRVDRTGQKRGCTAYYMVGEGTVDDYAMGVIERKRNVRGRVLDGVEPGTVMDEVLATMTKEQTVCKRQRTRQAKAT